MSYGLLALALLAALVVFLSADDTRAAPPPFDPGGIVCMENLRVPANATATPLRGSR
jgi:hypothetical protein